MSRNLPHRMTRRLLAPLGALLIMILLPAAQSVRAAAPSAARPIVESGPSEGLVLPPPFASRSVANPPNLLEWPQEKRPLAPPGFEVSLFAGDLDNPRSILVLPDGDVLVMESLRQRAASRIVLFRDSTRKGRPDFRRPFIRGLNMAYGMALVGERLYVGNTDGIVVFPYHSGAVSIDGRGSKILDLPAGGHYTRNIVADRDGRKLYVTVGSISNVGEEGGDAKDARRAAILQTDADGGGMRIFASGLRNPVGMGWEPKTNVLWTVVNERDLLGDALVPDYLTSVQSGGFYGWPYAYFGQNLDPRPKQRRPDLVGKAIKPDYALGSHVAPLGMAFYTGDSFPARYRGGVFIAMHGSWNRSTPVGYKVAFVPFRDGKPAGAVEDFLTGFMANPRTNEIYGRPAAVAVWTDGSLLVADDTSGRVWRVSVRH